MLELEGGKYYVGSATVPPDFVDGNRMLFRVKRTEWLRRHRPVRLLSLRPGVDVPEEEDRCTAQCMVHYGVDNVRGGSYASAELSPEDRARLLIEVRAAAADICYASAVRGP